MSEKIIQTSSLVEIADMLREWGYNDTDYPDGMPFRVIKQTIQEILDSTVYINNRTAITDNACYAVKSITRINCSRATTVGNYAFFNCEQLKSATLAKAVSIGTNAFYGAWLLRKVDLGAAELINSNAFNSCNELTALVIRTETMCVLEDVAALEGTPIAGFTELNYYDGKLGYVYVPSVLIEQYKADSIWVSVVEDRFRALEDYTVDGTITGELDMTKI